jgi:hypothetical protein
MGMRGRNMTRRRQRQTSCDLQQNTCATAPSSCDAALAAAIGFKLLASFTLALCPPAADARKPQPPHRILGTVEGNSSMRSEAAGNVRSCTSLGCCQCQPGGLKVGRITQRQHCCYCIDMLQLLRFLSILQAASGNFHPHLALFSSQRQPRHVSVTRRHMQPAFVTGLTFRGYLMQVVVWVQCQSVSVKSVWQNQAPKSGMSSACRIPAPPTIFAKSHAATRRFGRCSQAAAKTA